MNIHSQITPLFKKNQIVFSLCALVLLAGCSYPQTSEEVVFQSGDFRIVGDLTLPEGSGPHPVILFVHGDGPNNRTSGGSYVPIMERMLRVGYAIFAWDKPGTGESTGQIDRSRLREERAQIVLDAITMLKDRPDIDHRRIGLWGISQAGYVMPTVLSRSDDIAFMVAVSCPGVAGVDQGAYLVSEQARCTGLPDEDVDQVEHLLAEIERVQSYEAYADLKEQIDSYPLQAAARQFGLTRGVKPRDEWHAGNLEGEYFWNPMQIIEETTIPVLAFFGTKDTQVDPYQGAQAYQTALEQAGNPNFHIELIQGGDHNLIPSETGCLEERRTRSASGWRNYPPEYLDTLEEWLRTLNQ